MIVQADYELLELKLEEKLEEITALKKECENLKAKLGDAESKIVEGWEGAEIFDEIKRENATLRKELSAYKKGIRPEDAAKTDDEWLLELEGGLFVKAKFECLEGGDDCSDEGWVFAWCMSEPYEWFSTNGDGWIYNDCPQPVRAHPLPQKEKS